MIKEFLRYCRQLGQNPALTQGAGGNASYKKGEKMWVKASGVKMKSLQSDSLIKCDYWLLKKYLSDQKKYSRRLEMNFNKMVLDSCQNPTAKPSIETGLHAAIPSAYIFHTHNVYANVLNCMAGGEKILRRIFGKKFAYIPYKNPGAELALALAKYHKLPPLIFLQNHGLITHAAKINKACDYTNDASKAVIKFFKTKKAYTPFWVTKQTFSFKRHLFPDSAVYGSIDYTALPASKKRVYFEIASVSRYILSAIKKLKGKPIFLSAAQIKFLKNMEQEKHRLNLLINAK